MKQWKRLLYYLLINVLVSACTTVTVLYLWDRTHPAEVGQGGPAAISALGSGLEPGSTAAPLDSTAPNTTVLTTTVQAPLLTATPEAPREDPYENAEAYEVQPGDTLGLIAEKFEISVDDLLEYNALDDPNQLSAGQVIYIPTESVDAEENPIETEEPTLAPVVDDSQAATPSGPPQEARVVINGVIGAGDLASEHVFFTRIGDGKLSLAGWQLEDEDGNAYIFPQLELYEDGGVNVWSTTGTNTVVDLYWGLQAPVWESGETLKLIAADGEEHTTYKIP